MKYLGLFIMTILLFSCAASKQSGWLSEHKNMLQAATGDDVSTEKKLDALANSYVEMMHESLDFLNPKKGYAYALRYNEENGALLEDLIGDISPELQSLDRLGKITWGTRMLSKSYTKDLVQLFPRFQKKYKMANRIVDVNKRIKEGILDAILKRSEKETNNS